MLGRKIYNTTTNGENKFVVDLKSVLYTPPPIKRGAAALYILSVGGVKMKVVVE